MTCQHIKATEDHYDDVREAAIDVEKNRRRHCRRRPNKSSSEIEYPMVILLLLLLLRLSSALYSQYGCPAYVGADREATDDFEVSPSSLYSFVIGVVTSAGVNALGLAFIGISMLVLS